VYSKPTPTFKPSHLVVTFVFAPYKELRFKKSLIPVKYPEKTL
jgi:hypothetical protein